MRYWWINLCFPHCLKNKTESKRHFFWYIFRVFFIPSALHDTECNLTKKKFQHWHSLNTHRNSLGKSYRSHESYVYSRHVSPPQAGSGLTRTVVESAPPDSLQRCLSLRLSQGRQRFTLKVGLATPHTSIPPFMPFVKILKCALPMFFPFTSQTCSNLALHGFLTRTTKFRLASIPSTLHLRFRHFNIKPQISKTIHLW